MVAKVETCSVDSCGRGVKYPSRGWCGLHYQRWYKTGDPQGLRGEPKPISERLWSKVRRAGPSDCWVWTGGTNDHGYGRISTTRERGPVLTHRLSWELETGVDPGDLVVLHLCDNPPCVNPRHLVLGLQGANVYDMLRKGRSQWQS